MIVLLSPLVALAGALVYALSSNGKASELGRLAFGCGLLVCLWVFASTKVVFP